ncbi:MAG: DNA mismatch repair endonuclease MutL, partial [Chloroflexi bacterium]|nr:DNA mismatch repair endonuclease MutL [Chloroflexota bacterium]
MSIKVLAPEVAVKIAAGEVVTRPESVVRELVDNALDAQATRVKVEIRGGGQKLIRVADNGCGIAAEEIEVAFQRHATSKIQAAEDLFQIRTLGFRGEALPSIAAVSQMSLCSKTAADQAGSEIVLEAGQVLERREQACPDGTVVAVRNLFHNVPARLKFMRSASTEAGHIHNLISQYALAYPGVKLTLISDGRLLLESPGNGVLYDVIIKVHGLEMAKGMIAVSGVGEGSGNELAVSGYVSQPSTTRATRNYLSFFVNHRLVQSRMLIYAVEEAYHTLLMTGRHPVSVLDLTVDPARVDVNVHPAKTEVRFLNERDVFSVVQKSVRRALSDGAVIPALGPRKDASGTEELQRRLILEGAGLEGSRARSTAVAAESAPSTEMPQDPVAERNPLRLPLLRVLGQMAATFIIAEGPEGMYLIDQHDAHERVIYEQIRNQRAKAEVQSQLLLEPLSVEIAPQQVSGLAEKWPILSEVGFQVEPFGERTYLIRAVPAVLRDADIPRAFLDILDELGSDREADNWSDRIAASLACHSAIRAGQVLSMEEMRRLVQQLAE